MRGSEKQFHCENQRKERHCGRRRKSEVSVLEYNDSGNVKMSHYDLSMWTGEGKEEKNG